MHHPTTTVFGESLPSHATSWAQSVFTVRRSVLSTCTTQRWEPLGTFTVWTVHCERIGLSEETLAPFPHYQSHSQIAGLIPRSLVSFPDHARSVGSHDYICTLTPADTSPFLFDVGKLPHAKQVWSEATQDLKLCKPTWEVVVSRGGCRVLRKQQACCYSYFMCEVFTLSTSKWRYSMYGSFQVALFHVWKFLSGAENFL